MKLSAHCIYIVSYIFYIYILIIFGILQCIDFSCLLLVFYCCTCTYVALISFKHVLRGVIEYNVPESRFLLLAPIFAHAREMFTFPAPAKNERTFSRVELR